MSGFFSTKQEIESLQAENINLKAKIPALEKIIQNYEQSLERFTENSVSAAAYEEMKIFLQTEIETMRNQPMTRIHNERGAGRKSKATREQAEHILSLYLSGKGYRAIADILTTETGETWNKTTVRNIIVASK